MVSVNQDKMILVIWPGVLFQAPREGRSESFTERMVCGVRPIQVPAAHRANDYSALMVGGSQRRPSIATPLLGTPGAHAALSPVTPAAGEPALLAAVFSSFTLKRFSELTPSESSSSHIASASAHVQKASRSST